MIPQTSVTGSSQSKIANFSLIKRKFRHHSEPWTVINFTKPRLFIDYEYGSFGIEQPLFDYDHNFIRIEHFWAYANQPIFDFSKSRFLIDCVTTDVNYGI